MKKIILFSICLMLVIFNAMAQKKSATTKKTVAPTATTTTTKQAPAKNESAAVSESAPQKTSAETEEKKEDKGGTFSASDASVDASANERESMSYQEVYSMYKEKVDRIENDFLTKKTGIQKNTALTKEEIQKKIDEYNAYRVQLLTDLFGQKNFIEYENSRKH